MISPNVKFFLGTQAAIWTTLAIVTRASWIAFDAPPPSWAELIIYSAMGFIVSTTLAGLFVRIFDWPIVRQALAALALALLAATIWRVSFNAVIYHLLEPGVHSTELREYFHWGSRSVTQLLVWAGGFWALRYYTGYREQKLQTAAANAQAQAAKLRLLQYQVNPHFLFNTLGNLDTLLLKGDVPSARLMLEKLSDFMRQTLERDPTPAVSLGTEIERLEGYLDIVKIRVGDRLDARWNLADPLPEAKLPNGILLPLVENAVKHGAINSREGGYVLIDIQQADETLVIKIENDMKDASEPGFGIGLTNTRERLDTFYGGRATMLPSGRDGRYSVIMRLPVDHGAQDDDA